MLEFVWAPLVFVLKTSCKLIMKDVKSTALEIFAFAMTAIASLATTLIYKVFNIRALRRDSFQIWA